MRVLLVCEFEILNGAERSLLATVDRLSGERVRYSVACPPQGALTNAFVQRGIPVFPLIWKDSAGKTVAMDERRTRFAALVSAIQSNPETRIDLVHANSLSSSRMTGPVCRERGIRSIGHIRDIVRLSRQVVSDINQHDTILCVSAAVRRFHCEQGLAAEKTFVAYNGVDTEIFYPRPKLSLDFASIASPCYLRLGTAGQISLRKGMDVLMSATGLLADIRCQKKESARTEEYGDKGTATTQAVASEFHAASDFVPLELEIAGSRQSDKEETVLLESRLHQMAERINAGTNIHGIKVRFTGQLESLSEWLRTLDVYVHPARQEPLGRVLLEASATGLPVIATWVGGTEEIYPASSPMPWGANIPESAVAAPVENRTERESRLGANAHSAEDNTFGSQGINRQGAFLIPPDDPACLANALAVVTAEGNGAAKLRNALGIQGRQRIVQQYTVQQASDALVRFYRETAQGGR